MVFSGMMLLTAATWHGDWAQLSFTPRTIAAMVYLSIAGSLVAYSAYIYAIQHLPLSLVSLYAYINPIIAVTLGHVPACRSRSHRAHGDRGCALVLAGYRRSSETR